MVGREPNGADSDMENRLKIDITYPDLVRFLLDVDAFFSLNTVCFRTDASHSSGMGATLGIKIPGIELFLGCDAHIIQKAPNGYVFQVEHWNPGDEDRLWRFVAIAWTLMRAAAHPKFQRRAPGPSANLTVEFLLKLNPPRVERAAPSRLTASRPLSPSAPTSTLPPVSPPSKAPSAPKDAYDTGDLPKPFESLQTPLPTDSSDFRQSDGDVDLEALLRRVQAERALEAKRTAETPSAPSTETPAPPVAPEDAVGSAAVADTVGSAAVANTVGSLEEDTSTDSGLSERDKPAAALADGGPTPSPAVEVKTRYTKPTRHQRLAGLTRNLRRPVVERGPKVLTGPVGPPRKSLKQRPLAIWLTRLRQREASGWLEVFSEGVVRRFLFDRGEPIQIEQRPRPDIRLLATAALGVGVNWSHFENLSEKLEFEDNPEQKMLDWEVWKTEVAASVLSRRLSVQTGRSIDEGWSGEAFFVDHPPLEDEGSLRPSPVVPIPRIAWDGLRNRAYTASPHQAEQMVELLTRGKLLWISENDFPLHDATTRIEEQEVLQRCREELPSVIRTLDEDGGRDRLLLSCTWSLLLLGFFRLERDTIDETDPETLIELYRGREDALRKKDYFDALGLHWSIHPQEIRPAYEKSKQEYERHVDSSHGDLANLARNILLRIEKAYETLSDSVNRQNYRRQLVGKNLLGALRHALEQGELHEMRGERERALLCFERAADLTPGRAEVMDRLKRQRELMGLANKSGKSGKSGQSGQSGQSGNGP